MLTHRLIKRVELEHETGAWVEVRMPSFSILERAREVRSRKAMALMSGVDLQALKGLSSDVEQQAAPADAYDRAVLLQACMVAWSYAEPLTPDNVAELDEQTVGAVIAVLLPSESEDTRKKG